MAVGCKWPRTPSAFAVLVVFGAALVAPSGAVASPLDPSGVIRPLKAPHLATNQSGNWFGYNQGALEKGGKLFSSITADWTVPSATQHTRGQAEYSATWIGIGGGCVDAGCNIPDPTLIQTGTEQDVSSGGSPSYSAWWELIPAPAITISNMSVAPGDRMHASISQAAPEVWSITLADQTKGETFSQTVPYTSTESTAEWIEETPLVISGTGTGEAALPNLTETPFDNATVNGAPAGLASSEQIQLSNGSQVIGTPSAPDAEADGFGACAWATSCPVPAS